MVDHQDMLPSARVARRAVAARTMAERLRRIAFATLYGRGARLYDRFTDWLFLGEWRRWQETVLPLVPPTGLVVELGAGTGRLAEMAILPERRWLAIEPSASMVAVIGHRRRRGVRGVRATAAAVPLPDGVANAVVATFPTRYVLEPAAAAEMRRILAQDGRVVVVLDGTLAPHGPRRRLRRRALGLFYASAGEGKSMPFRVAGFEGETRAIRTAHGTATVYVGRRAD